MVQAALDHLQGVIAQCGAAVYVQPGLPRVVASQTLLEQILTNLLANALAYGARPGEAPRVEVGCDDLGEQWRLYVRDRGPGIPPDQRERIFGLFERLALGTTANPEGTGLGLTIVRRAAEALGGAAGVDSPPGGGATFWVVFPKVPAAAGRREALAPVAAGVAGAPNGATLRV